MALALEAKAADREAARGARLGGTVFPILDAIRVRELVLYAGDPATPVDRCVRWDRRDETRFRRPIAL